MVVDDITYGLCVQRIADVTTIAVYIGIGLFLIIAFMVVLMLISGYWFKFGIVSKWKRAKGYDITRIFTPDGSETWHWHSNKKIINQIPGEKVAFIYEPRLNTRFKGLKFANFDRFKLNQKIMSEDQDEIEVKEENIQELNKPFWRALQFWKKENSIKTISKYTIIKQKDATNTGYTDINPSEVDTILSEQLQIARQENAQKSIWVYIILFFIIFLVLLDIYLTFDLKGYIQPVLDWVRVQANKVVL